MMNFRIFIELISITIFCFIMIAGIGYPFQLKEVGNEKYYIMDVYVSERKVLKEKYELLETGRSLRCFGHYDLLKLKNNDSLNINEEIIVCKS